MICKYNKISINSKNYQELSNKNVNYENYENLENLENYENSIDLYIKNLKEENLHYKNQYNIFKNNFNCIICLDNYIEYIPTCGHMGLCVSCKTKLNSRKVESRCVICTKKIKYIKMFMSFSLESIDDKDIYIENKDITEFNSLKFLKNEIKETQKTIDLLEISNNKLLDKKKILIDENNLLIDENNLLIEEKNNIIKEIEKNKNNNNCKSKCIYACNIM